MKTITKNLGVLFTTVLLFQQGLAQENSSFQCKKVSGNVYCLYGQGGNVGFPVNNEGILKE